MKKIKSIICLIMAIIMFTICVSAEGTKNVSFKLNFSKDEVLVSENNIETFDTENGYYNPGNVGMAYGSKIIDVSNLPSPENQEEQISVLSTQTPSLTIVETTSTSITFDVVFPVSAQPYNTIRIIDFNSDDGLTKYYNPLGDDSVWGRSFQFIKWKI